MAFIIRYIISLIQLLHSENGDKQLAWGIVLGAFWGISPFISLQGLVVLLILLLFRVQFGMAFVSAFIFKFLFTFLAPVMHQLGSFTLEIESLKTLYTWGTNTPLIPFTKFNHSVVMGGLIVGIILAPVNYFLSLYMIRKYRSTVVERVKNSKIAKVIKASSLYKVYEKYDRIYNH